MPRIHTITTDTVLSDNDMLLGTDGANGANNATKNFSFGVFKNFITTNVTFTGDTIISGGTLTLDNNKFLMSKMANGTAVSLIGVNASNQIKISGDNLPIYTGTGLTSLGGNLELPNGNIIANGTLSASGYNDSNWNAAYVYSQVGHLPLTGGTITGDMTIGDASTDTLAIASKTTLTNGLDIGVDGNGHDIKIFGDTSGKKITFDPTGNASLSFTDSTMAKFGNNADLQIYHNGTANYIDSNGGNMNIRAAVNDGKIFFLGDDGNGGYADYFFIDGSTAVYDGNQGQNVSRETRFPPDAKATFGITGAQQTSMWTSNGVGHFYLSEQGGGDMYLHSDGAKIVIGKRGAGATHQNPLTDAENMIVANTDGSVELYHDNTKKLETTATGITVTGSIAGALNTTGGTLHDPTFTGTVTSNANLIVLAGQDTAAQIELKADAGDNNDDHWKLSAGSDATFRILTRDGGTYSSVLDFIASNKIAYFKGDVNVVDNKKLLVGTGNDLEIFHDGSDSYVSDTGDGNLYLKGGNQVRIVGDTANSDEIWAVFGADAAELWFDGNKKLETTNTGIKVTGAAEIGNFKIPAVMGSAGQVLKVPSSGSLLEFADDDGALLGIQQGGEFTNSLIVGHAGTGSLTSALGNTGVGVGAMNAITEGDGNVALGHDSLGALTTGSNNTGIGKQALFTLVGSHSNVAVGKDSLYNANTQDATNFPDNGSKNVAIGFNAGSGITYGKENVFIGYEAGKTFTTGQKNICIGHGADATSTNGAKFNSIAIGHGVKITSSNTIVIGSSDYNRTTVHALHDHAGILSNASTTLTKADSGKTYEAAGNPGSGYTVNLPDAGSTGVEAGWHVEVQISVNPTNNLKVVAHDTSTDKLIGYVQCINASTGATSIFRAQASDNYSAITFNGTSQGTVGSNVKIKRGVFSDKFNISGTLICTTTPVNPFTTT